MRGKRGRKQVSVILAVVAAFLAGAFSSYVAIAQIPSAFHTPEEIACTSRLCITATGLGIGTTSPSPSHRLAVEGSIIVNNPPTTWSGIDMYSGGTNRVTVYNYGGSFAVDTAGASRMAIDTAGNVLIGANTPNGKLTLRNDGSTATPAGWFANMNDNIAAGFPVFVIQHGRTVNTGATTMLDFLKGDGASVARVLGNGDVYISGKLGGACALSPKGTFSLGSYHGYLAPSSGLTGYYGAAQICRGSDPNSRMCTAQDLMLAKMCGVSTATGWIGTGESANLFDDCHGYTYGASCVVYGSYWDGTTTQFNCCNNLNPILCCVF